MVPVSRGRFLRLLLASPTLSRGQEARSEASLRKRLPIVETA